MDLGGGEVSEGRAFGFKNVSTVFSCQSAEGFFQVTR